MLLYKSWRSPLIQLFASIYLLLALSQELLNLQGHTLFRGESDVVPFQLFGYKPLKRMTLVGSVSQIHVPSAHIFESFITCKFSHDEDSVVHQRIEH